VQQWLLACRDRASRFHRLRGLWLVGDALFRRPVLRGLSAIPFRKFIVAACGVAIMQHKAKKLVQWRLLPLLTHASGYDPLVTNEMSYASLLGSEGFER